LPIPIIEITETNDTTHPLDADNEEVGVVFRVPKTGTLDRVHFRVNTVTTGDDVRVSFQNVNASGDPDGTEDQFRVVTIADVDDDTYFDSGLITSNGTDGGTKRSVTQGDFIAIIFRFDSFVAGNLQLSTGIGTGGDRGEPTTKSSTGGGSTWSETSRFMNLALEYDDGLTLAAGIYPWKEITTVTVASDETPDEYGMKFQVPFSLDVIGWAWPGTSLGTSMKIENAAKTTILGPVTMEADPSATGTLKRTWIAPAAVTLAKNTDYYLVYTPDDTTNRALKWFELQSAAFRACWPFGTTQAKVERTDNGAWTETTTHIIPFSLITTGFDDVAGSVPCNLVNGIAVIPETCPV